MKTKTQKRFEKQSKLSSKWCNTNTRKWVHQNRITTLEQLRGIYPYLNDEEFEALPAYQYIKFITIPNS